MAPTMTQVDGGTLRTDAGVRVCDAAAAAVFLLGLCMYLLTAATVESFGSDTSTYYALARSILYEHRYWFDFEPHTMYPPGFPLLLAGLMALGVQSFAALVKACVVVYFIGVAGLYLLVRRERGARTALAIVALVVTSYVFYFWSTVGVHSEAAYFTSGVLALLCADIAEGATTVRRRVLAHVGVALFASYLLLARTIGATLIGGLILWVILPVGRRDAGTEFWSWARLLRWGATIAVPVAVLGAWLFWSSTNRPRNDPTDYMQSYVQQAFKEDPHQLDSGNVSFRSLPSRTMRIIAMRIENGTRTMLNVSWLPLGWKNPVCLLLAALVAAGWAISVKRQGTLAHWYVLVYMGMLLFYPFDEGSRYLHPVHPFLLLFGIDGLDALKNRVKQSQWVGAGPLLRLGTLVLLAVILLAGVYQISVLARTNIAPDAGRFLNAATVATADWIKANTPENAVIMGDQSSILHRLTGRKTLRFPLSTDPRVLRNRITSAGVNFIVVLNERPYEYFNPSTMRRFTALAAQYPDAFVPVHVFTEGTIYRFKAAPGFRSGL